MTTIRTLIAGNWKMNGLQADLNEFSKMAHGDRSKHADALICVPYTLIGTCVNLPDRGDLSVGAQNCHALEKGAHTGEISAEMIGDIGAEAVIVGHSERRTDQKETDAMVNAKALACYRSGLTAIICIGETRQEREQGITLDVVARQLAASVPEDANDKNTVIAYEPVWAIGTGLVPSIEDIAEVHSFVRTKLETRFGEAGGRMRILYGGSVKPSNASEILSILDVNGALVGGASLKAEDFLGILNATA